jgi:crotonobetainyl-CoA:carnitine CoA-transferase CaiB-like acyl-CoA transferase
MGWTVSNYLVAGVPPEPTGDQNATAAPSGTFDTADGPLNIAANRQEQFESLCRVVGRSDLMSDVRFAEREGRKTHREALNDELNQTLRLRPAAEWERLLTAVGVPAARILTVPQAVELEQLHHRGFIQELPFPDGSGRPLRVMSSGVLFDGEPLTPADPPPLLGEHNTSVPELIASWRAARLVSEGASE